MSLLLDLLPAVNYSLLQGNLEQEINELVFDSRKATAESVFFAIVGSTNNGHEYIQSVYEKGCRVFVVQEETTLPADATIIKVSNTSEALGRMACAFFDNPSQDLKLVGITGTNGKTTTTTLLHKLFTELGYKCGLISTVVNKIGTTEIPSTHTTPDPINLNALLSKMVAEGCEYCFMEVSSHAVHQHRITGLEFVGAGFTNITHDHLDYHKTFAEYIRVKKAFFDGLGKEAFALVNSDDKNGLVMLQNTAAKKVTYALKTPADFKGKVIENELTGLIMTINNTEVYSRLVGDFNAYNLLVVFGVSQLLGMDELEVLRIISNLESVEGRFQYVRSNSGITAIVDYAHTPDALENVLKTINGIRKGTQKVITLVGCGGDRDKTKRPKMAQIACDLSTQAILTSDNPRTENPQTILEEMEAGLDVEQQTKALTIQDRKQAIKTAISLANAGDILLIAGKGHEKYQEIMGVKHDFDDLKITEELFNQLKK
ncbi:MAG: UDP-N-acetylmuramoyl-L-alanyl-D-glutamate--2,6-diaminopimelate ligase [Flavobacteriales bacterium]|nr:UDP-N-acetylmuramoyl-L-alanyl-D-glutamate--2,6-diaminopimelate ligase [Flavobacteriales bacterium]